MRPLRQRNFLGLQLHRHLRQGEASWMMTIPASETKTHQSLHLPFPQILVPALERYLALYRPLLLAMRGPSNSRHPGRPAVADLWVSRCGTAMTPGALQKLLRRHTRARFGHEVNCHLFRDCVASSVADDDPVNVRIAADLLGHRSLQTTQRHYITANQRAALRRIGSLIRQHRREARRRAAPRRGEAP
jgi:integrase